MICFFQEFWLVFGRLLGEAFGQGLEEVLGCLVDSSWGSLGDCLVGILGKSGGSRERVLGRSGMGLGRGSWEEVFGGESRGSLGREVLDRSWGRVLGDGLVSWGGLGRSLESRVLNIACQVVVSNLMTSFCYKIKK